MKKFFKQLLAILSCSLIVCAVFCFSFVPLSTASAKADENFGYYGTAGFKCYSYDVELTVNEDRTITFQERIDVEALRNFTMFYKSLPTDSIYTQITAKCEGNDAFNFYVMDNPNIDGFIDLCCEGNVKRGNRWVYEFSYVMQPNGEDISNGMILDVVGFGSSFALNDVDVTVHFPQKPLTCQRSYGGYNSSSGLVDVTEGWSNDGKTLKIHEDVLEVKYNSEFGEYTAEGITLSFTFEKGVLKSFASTRIITPRTWLVVVLCALLIGGAVALWLFGKKQGEIVTVVNVKAPDRMDPMQMGYLLDGTVDNEDVTSMLYYFAAKGYLTIDFTDESDPVLERVKVFDGGFVELPDDAPSYQKTLFYGLFKNKQVVSVSELNEKFYEHVDTAKMQMHLKKRKRYDRKSVLCFVANTALCAVIAALCPVLYGLLFVGGGYASPIGIFCSFIAIFLAVFALAVKEKEFKRSKRLLQGILLVVYIIGGAIFSFAVASHLMVEAEKILLVVCMAIAQVFGYLTLSRTEEYNRTLGDILGFKDFIKVTEEDKIKFMLEENPELYYDILPYAQVLDVTDEWEDKFKNITLQPPQWAVYNEPYFNYVMINRSMRTATRYMLSRPQNTGSGVGRSGGGGSFGGFSGGGRGGGGFGGR
ncbi:MAG: DUF2207 domain-containing protein [Clostridia bacterium]|nr:DUF2207 domain-containing protein [Clostridia bacterium]